MTEERNIWDIINTGRDDGDERVELDAELSGKIVELGGAKQIRHPCCCDEYHRKRHSNYNLSLEEWKAKRAQAREAANWQVYVECSEKLFWADALLEIKAQVPAPEWAQVVRNAWILSDQLWEIWPKWRTIFADRAALPGFMTRDEAAYLAGCNDPITVYRGCHEATIDGLSWTTDLDAAVYFEYHVKPRHVALIVEGHVNRSDVFAFVDKNEEFEVIVLPECVIERKVLKKSGRWIEE
jgi:hypothetical protein